MDSADSGDAADGNFPHSYRVFHFKKDTLLKVVSLCLFMLFLGFKRGYPLEIHKKTSQKRKEWLILYGPSQYKALARHASL